MQRLESSSRFLCLLLCLLSCFCSSCSRAALTCRSEYLFPEYLASEQIDTPDPYRQCYYGQQIVVSWNFKFSHIESPIELLLHVRYGTREIETFTTTITRSRGYWVFRLINDGYWCRRGIVSFQAQLCQDGCLLDEWTHHLWSEIIEISSS